MDQSPSADRAPLREDSAFHADELEAQALAGVSANGAGIRNAMTEPHRDFFRTLPHILLGTTDAAGWPLATLLEGDPGFVQALDPVTLRIEALPHPDDPAAGTVRIGNDVAILGIDLATRRRNRANGTVAGLDASGFAVAIEQSFFLLAHISYLQAFVDVNERAARLASIIPLIRADCVPQSFVDVDRDQYLKAKIALYEPREAGPLAEVYSWSYRRTCRRYDISVQAIGFDEIAALYRPQRRALVADLVRCKVAPDQVSAWLAQHIPQVIEPQHRAKFLADVAAELKHLDISRIAGLGLTREELESWRKPPS